MIKQGCFYYVEVINGVNSGIHFKACVALNFMIWCRLKCFNSIEKPFF